ncbi:MAG TPA: peptidylprolyl isomerase [Burkholderiales bacterium]|nr:peptidylprolyl isomerase [Burkholderiales bacterium]
MNPAIPRLALAALVALGLTARDAIAQDKGAAATRVATVNGVAIPKSRVDIVVRAQQQRGVPDSEGLRNEIKEQLIVREIVAQEAAKKGLAKSPDVLAQLELSRQEVLWGAYIAEFIKNTPISDAQIKTEYERVKAQRGEKEYKVRHILVENEDEAKQVIADLKKGRKFEELAKQSKDPGSKDRGGDLDWNAPAGYVKPFADAMVKLTKGKYTEAPVQTQFGWHVILLEDVRDTKFPTLDEAKPQIAQALQQQQFTKAVQDLRAKAKVE